VSTPTSNATASPSSKTTPTSSTTPESSLKATICSLAHILPKYTQVYHPHFKCNRKSLLKDYPNLLNYARELFQMPGVALSVNMQHIKTHYYSSHPTLNHFAMLPAGPRFLHELYKPHDRERFPRRRVGLW